MYTKKQNISVMREGMACYGRLLAVSPCHATMIYQLLSLVSHESLYFICNVLPLSKFLIGAVMVKGRIHRLQT